eukprot:1980680-Pyramimonas_sp.AAC.1
MVMISFYAHSYIGLRGANLGRFQRLAGLSWSLQLPWIVAGDFNMSPQQLERSGIVSRLHAVVLQAKGTATCNLGSGT